jgi:CubicO group peptidase (beta-lactamase class C family)
MTYKVKTHGYCDPQFAAVKDVFTKNFETGLEVGASFAVTINGKFVVDLWAGYRDAAKTKPWQQDTIVNVYSTTKIMTALCVLILVERGQLDLDIPVAKYWPEFAQAGKEKIPVRWLLSHMSGVAGFDQPLKVEDLYKWDYIVNLLAAQKPWWEPGKHSGYHSITFGFLLGELVLRVSGKSLGQFFQDEVALPLKTDFFIGVPEDYDARVAELIPPPPVKPAPMNPESIPARIFTNPPITPAYSKDRAWRAAEIPATNGHGNARSAARIGSIFSNWGNLDGLQFLSRETIKKAIQEQHHGKDLVLGIDLRYGLGFGLNQKGLRYPNPNTIYWGGVGGSWLVMDLDAKMCFCYAMNKMVNDSVKDPRSVELKKALFSALK